MDIMWNHNCLDFLCNHFQNLNEKTKIPDCTGEQMPAIEVFSAGIRYLKTHLFTHFNERIPMRDADIHWVLTVPAIWDEAAKKFMRICAEKVCNFYE